MKENAVIVSIDGKRSWQSELTKSSSIAPAQKARLHWTAKLLVFLCIRFAQYRTKNPSACLPLS